MHSAETADAVRHAYLHPGFTLAAWETVAIPVYAVAADLVLQQEKTLPPLDEFVLEAVEAGVDTLSGIEGLLGLEQHVVTYAVTKQITHDYMVVVPRSDRPEAQLSLTPLGKEALETLRYTVPAREQYRMVFDRLLWQPIARRQNDLMRGRDHVDRDLVALPRAERRQVAAADLRPQDVAAQLNRDGQNGLRVDVLAVSAIVRQDARYLEAQLLVFVSDDSDDRRYEVAIDGVLSPKHTEALARDARVQQLPFVVAPPAAAPALRDGLARVCVPLEEAREANQALLRSRRHSPGDPPDGAAAADDAPGPAVREIDTWEHRVLMDEALAAARSRLLIATLGVCRDVVDSSWLAALEKVVERRVDVRIVIGPPAGPAQERDVVAAAELQALAKEHPTLHVTRVEGPLSPALVWDGVWVAGEFDWLGHRASRPREIRVERGVLVRVQEDADAAARALLDVGWPEAASR